MSRTGWRLLIAGLIVIAVGLVVFATRFDSDFEPGISPVVGVSVPDLTLPSLNGEAAVNLRTATASSNVVVVNFFASWCLQCRHEHRHLLAAADVYTDRSVRFLGVAFQDRDADARGFLDELGWGDNFEYLTDPGSAAAIELGVFGIPETIFLRDGLVAGKLIGQTDALTLSTALETVLAGATVDATQVGEFRQNPDNP